MIDVEKLHDEVAMRFWANVDKTPGHGPDGACWLWTGTKSGKGYGGFYYAGKTQRAHRVSLWLSGSIAPSGRNCAMHACDNRMCVNPDHLSWGTVTDNNRDMRNKGRMRGSPAELAKRTHCHRGHELSGNNLKPRSTGVRECRICANLATNRYRARLAAKP